MLLFEMFIGAFMLWTSAFLVGKMLMIESYKNKNIFNILLITIFSIILGIINLMNAEILHGIIKILFIYIMQCAFFKFAFKKDTSKTIIVALIFYLSLFLSEVIFALIASIALSSQNQSLEFLKNTVLMNFIISTLIYTIIRIFKKFFVSVIQKISSNNKSNLIIFLVMLITISLLMYRIPVNNWKLTPEFAVTMLIIIGFLTVGFYMLKQKSDIDKTLSMYQQEVKYSKNTSKILEDYRIINHEHKNQLSIIRQMLEHNKKGELIEYIDNLLDKRNIIKYKWVADLNNLPLEGLKGLINYKLLEIEISKINYNVIISKDVSKVKLNKLSTKQQDNLYSIVGVYLDNAIQAARESKTKKLSIEIYKENKDLVLIIGNTYKGKINLDKIDDYGYTTKGKNHGIGLHIVSRILDEEHLFSQNRKIVDDYYIQELRIHINELKSKKTKKK